MSTTVYPSIGVRGGRRLKLQHEPTARNSQVYLLQGDAFRAPMVGRDGAASKECPMFESASSSTQLGSERPHRGGVPVYLSWGYVPATPRNKPPPGGAEGRRRAHICQPPAPKRRPHNIQSSHAPVPVNERAGVFGNLFRGRPSAQPADPDALVLPRVTMAQ